MSNTELLKVEVGPITENTLIKKSTFRIANELISPIAMLIDFVVIVGVAFTIDQLIFQRSYFLSELAEASIFIAIVFIFISFTQNIYNLDSILQNTDKSKQIITIWPASFMLLLGIGFLFKITDQFSRLSIVLYFVMGGIAIFTANKIFSFLLRAQLRAGAIAFQRVQAIVLGDPSEVESLNQVSRQQGFEIVGLHCIAQNTKSFSADCVRVTAGVREMLAQTKCDSILIFAPWQGQRRISELANILGPMPIPVALMADSAVNKIFEQRQIRFGHVTGFEIQRAPLNRSERILKRGLDVVVATAAIVLLSPILFMTALAVLCESGRPILFRQNRKGFGGKQFSILKFRSMRVQQNGEFVPQAKRDDPRVTKIGRIIRKTSIDELPQLFNVLRGEMSIVGPRPHALAHDSHYDEMIAFYAFRHHVKPGITGWAQINGHRGETRETKDMESRVELDLWYINHWSIWLDIVIILRTASAVFADPNAY